MQGERKGHKALSLCISRKVGANPGSRYDQVYQGVAEEELEKIKQLKQVEAGQRMSDEKENADPSEKETKTAYH